MTRRSLLISGLLILAFTANAQLIATVTDIKSQFDYFNSNNPSEKVYIKTDKDIYHAGDNLWYGGFIVDYNSQKPSSTSQSLFVSIIDTKNRVIGRSRTPNYEGVTRGDFILSDTLQPGIYEVVAYSSLQRQTGNPESYFRKYIRIVDRNPENVDFTTESNEGLLLVRGTNKFTGGVIAGLEIGFELYNNQGFITEGIVVADAEGYARIPIDENINFIGLRAKYLSTNNYYYLAVNGDKRIDISVYPESGNLINGLWSKMAVKVMNSLGKPLELKGVLVKGDEILNDNIQTDENGVASFDLLPDKNERFRLKFNYLGEEVIHELKPPKDNGYVFSQKRLGDKLIFNVTGSESKSESVYLIGQMHGNIAFAAMVDIKGSLTYGADIATVSSGILHTYLIDENKKILASSAIFIDNGSNRTVVNHDIVSDSETLRRLRLDADTLAATVSIVVCDSEASVDNFGYGIREYLTFFSDLKLSSKSLKFENLNNFLLTCIPDRYDWFKTRTVPPVYASGVLGYDKISGLATYDNGEPLITTDLILHSQGNKVQSWFSSTDDQGRFEFSEVDYSPGAEFALGALKIKQRYKVNFMLNEDHQYHTYSFDPKIWDSFYTPRHLRSNDSIVDFSDAIVLKNVTKRGSRYNERLEERKLSLDRIKTKKADELNLTAGGPFSILSLIQQVTTVYSWSSQTGSVLLRSSKTFTGGAGVIFYVNNTRIGDSMFDLNFLNPNDIEEIKVYKTIADALNFPFAPDGVIQIITKKDKDYTTPAKSNHVQIIQPTYSQTRDYELVELNPEKGQINNPTSLWYFDHVNLNGDDKLKLDFEITENRPYSLSLEAVSKNGKVISIYQQVQ